MARRKKPVLSVKIKRIKVAKSKFKMPKVAKIKTRIKSWRP